MPCNPSSVTGSTGPFRGHFFGFYLHSGGFNIAVDARTRYQDCRPFWGAGISYGYVVPLNRCWGAEFTLGAGFVNVKYDQFYNIPNGARYGHGLTHTYWGVTRARDYAAVPFRV